MPSYIYSLYVFIYGITNVELNLFLFNSQHSDGLFSTFISNLKCAIFIHMYIVDVRKKSKPSPFSYVNHNVQRRIVEWPKRSDIVKEPFGGVEPNPGPRSWRGARGSPPSHPRHEYPICKLKSGLIFLRHFYHPLSDRGSFLFKLQWKPLDFSLPSHSLSTHRSVCPSKVLLGTIHTYIWTLYFSPIILPAEKFRLGGSSGEMSDPSRCALTSVDRCTNLLVAFCGRNKTKPPTHKGRICILWIISMRFPVSLTVHVRCRARSGNTFAGGSIPPSPPTHVCVCTYVFLRNDCAIETFGINFVMIESCWFCVVKFLVLVRIRQCIVENLVPRSSL